MHMGDKLFQIYETDLEDLERSCADLCDRFTQHLTNRQRTQLRRVKEILSSVRWNYGPHLDSIVVDDDEVEESGA